MSTPSDVKIYNPWREFIENVINGDNFFRTQEYIELLEYIDSLLAARAALSEGWVSVADRLPEPDEPVLAHNGKWTGVGAWCSGEHLEEIEHWQDEHREFIELNGPAVTHWMPLPAAPTLVGKEKAGC
jgi:hypothetical protein